MVNYLGYFRGAPIPNYVLHWVGRCHIALGFLIAVFVIGHASMALRHWFTRPIDDIERPALPDISNDGG
jgi:hypothetical protein